MDSAAILVGDELLAGHTKDTNGAWLAARLATLGHPLRTLRVIPDDTTVIAATLAEVAGQFGLVFVTGGLGPTHDDMTTEGVAQAWGLALDLSEEWVAHLRSRYGKRYPSGIPPKVEASARKMATIPHGARVLANSKGAACGYVLSPPPPPPPRSPTAAPSRTGTPGHGFVLVFPGVPTEMQAIFDEEAVKVLPPGQPTKTSQLSVRMPEAEFSEELGAIAKANPTVTVGSYPKWGSPVVVLRVRGPEEDVTRVTAMLEHAFREKIVPPEPSER
ncbi:MAG: competence/damage-inducible protein A [Thermoplasmatota archaeon]